MPLSGNTLILAGALLGLAAAGWSFYRGDAVGVTGMVTAPAVIIGGLNLVAGDSLLPHLAALTAVPLGWPGSSAGLPSVRNAYGPDHRTKRRAALVQGMRLVSVGVS